jgi:hypothetical protein
VSLSSPESLHGFTQDLRRTGVLRPRMGPSAVRIGLYISLNQCSLSKGLEHRLVSVIISRQMNPTPVLTSPT